MNIDFSRNDHLPGGTESPNNTLEPPKEKVKGGPGKKVEGIEITAKILFLIESNGGKGIRCFR